MGSAPRRPTTHKPQPSTTVDWLCDEMGPFPPHVAQHQGEDQGLPENRLMGRAYTRLIRGVVAVVSWKMIYLGVVWGVPKAITYYSPL